MPGTRISAGDGRCECVPSVTGHCLYSSGIPYRTNSERISASSKDMTVQDFKLLAQSRDPVPPNERSNTAETIDGVSPDMEHLLNPPVVDLSGVGDDKILMTVLNEYIRFVLNDMTTRKLATILDDLYDIFTSTGLSSFPNVKNVWLDYSNGLINVMHWLVEEQTEGAHVRTTSTTAFLSKCIVVILKLEPFLESFPILMGDSRASANQPAASQILTATTEKDMPRVWHAPGRSCGVPAMTQSQKQWRMNRCLRGVASVTTMTYGQYTACILCMHSTTSCTLRLSGQCGSALSVI